ncbi:DUF3309 family protein [Aureimonas fodinaquatilis]|uniref:DUF3309 family protein n=1 Tax=Aureimonas fodinaquatilis TaxID=2565783 RepID=UPI00165DD758|nr:hypothetical protein [Aureimonas fodinaquatilis]
MPLGAVINLIALTVFVGLWPIWPWSRHLGARPAILGGVALTITVLLWVTQII